MHNAHQLPTFTTASAAVTACVRVIGIGNGRGRVVHRSVFSPGYCSLMR